MVFENTGKLLAYAERERPAFGTQQILIRKNEIFHRKSAVKSKMWRFEIVKNAELFVQNKRRERVKDKPNQKDKTYKKEK